MVLPPAAAGAEHHPRRTDRTVLTRGEARDLAFIADMEDYRMCDYSLLHVKSRPAKIEDRLVTTSFDNSITRGFAAVGEPGVAVCLMPGTEIAFDAEVECEPAFRLLPSRKTGHRVARFRQIDLDNPNAHHDALEFPSGQIVLVTNLCEGQRATVLQLPATGQGTTAAPAEEIRRHMPVA